MPVWGSATKSRRWRSASDSGGPGRCASFMPCCTTAHSPVGGHHERVQVDLKAVGDRVVVDARGQAAGAHERVAVEPAALARSARSSLRRLARVACRVRRRCRCRARRARGFSPRFSAPITDVVMPEECQSMPITAAEGLEPEGIAEARQERRRAVVVETLSAMAVPSVVMRSASHGGTRPPCSGRSATPERFMRSIVSYRRALTHSPSAGRP